MFRVFLAVVLSLLVQNSFAQDSAAPQFTLPNAAGEQVTLPRSHDGVDIYFFWASWCPYCKALMPHLQSMQIEYGDDVTIYALTIRDEENPAPFIAEHGYDFELIPEADSIMEPYGVQTTPGVFIVDGQGNIRFNLYEMVFNDSNEMNSMGHLQKAGRRAPYWAAEIRKNIDQLLAEGKGK